MAQRKRRPTARKGIKRNPPPAARSASGRKQGESRTYQAPMYFERMPRIPVKKKGEQFMKQKGF